MAIPGAALFAENGAFADMQANKDVVRKNAANNSVARHDRKPDSSWTLSTLSDEKRFKLDLSCDTAPMVGAFQRCRLIVFSPKQKGSKITGKKARLALKQASIRMDGGMPAHHHGLPTSPVVSWSEEEQHYTIQGLKYSMPGEWVLRFYIETIEAPDNTQSNLESLTDKRQSKNLRDRAEFHFTVRP